MSYIEIACNGERAGDSSICFMHIKCEVSNISV